MDLYTVMEPSCSISHISGKPASVSLTAKEALISVGWGLHHRAPKCPDTLLVGVYLLLFIYPIGLIQQVWDKGHRGKYGRGDSLGLLATEANGENRPQHHHYSDNVGWGGLAESLSLLLVSLPVKSPVTLCTGGRLHG